MSALDRLVPDPPVKGLMAAAFGLVLFGFFGTLLWSISASLGGAVIATGLVSVESEVKKIQHPTGGIVGHVAVRNGQKVAPGDLLMSLDDTQARSALALLENQMAQLEGRRARLEAERDDRDSLAPLPPAGLTLPSIAEVRAAEQRFLTESRSGRAQQKAQIEERIGQLYREIEGQEAQFAARGKERALIATELEGVEDLYRKNLVSIARVTAMQRDAARLSGELGALTAGMARSRGQIAELTVQRLGIDQTARIEAVRELREVEAGLAGVQEKRVAAADTLRRVDLKAPQGGRVHDLSVHTIGGVIGAGELVMLIIPDSDRLIFEARVSPLDIDQIKPNQNAVLRLSGFNQRLTPELSAHVLRVGADLSREPQSGTQYFAVRLALDAIDVEKAARLNLMPGMPVEVFISTEARSAFSYFAKPISDAFYRAFREK